jgi:hypothetical protein
MIKKRSSVLVSAVVEASTGVALLALPRPVARLLLGADLTGVGVATARMAGLALVALALACWPERDGPLDRASARAARALLTYNALASVYFVYLRGFTGYHGIALLPAMIYHAAMALLLTAPG